MARSLRLLPFAALAALALAVTAFAQSAAKPVPACHGVQIADPAGDASSAATDVTDVFFLTVGSKTTVNVTIKDLQTPDDAATGPQTRWYVAWTIGEAQKFVRAGSDGTFAYGTLEGTGYSTEGDTSGKFHPGADGIIEIVVPGGSAGRGKKLEAPVVEVKNTIAHPAGAAFLTGTDPDRAPDAEGGRDYTVATCDPAGSPSPPTTGEQVVQKGALQVSAPTRVKAPKSKSLAVRLTSSGRVSDVQGRLLKGRRVLGTGKVAAVERRATLKLKLARKAKKGSYSLHVLGTNPDGKRADKTFKLRLR